MGVKQRQKRPKLSLPLELCYTEADLAAVNDTKMLCLEKWNVLAHCGGTFIVPLGKTIVFLAAAYEP